MLVSRLSSLENNLFSISEVLTVLSQCRGGRYRVHRQFEIRSRFTEGKELRLLVDRSEVALSSSSSLASGNNRSSLSRAVTCEINFWQSHSAQVLD